MVNNSYNAKADFNEDLRKKSLAPLCLIWSVFVSPCACVCYLRICEGAAKAADGHFYSVRVRACARNGPEQKEGLQPSALLSTFKYKLLIKHCVVLVLSVF